MKNLTRSRLAKTFYGFAFVVAVPAALAAWAHASRSAIHLAVLHLPGFGACLTGIGVATILAAMLSLWRDGGGLPMNAFPPPRFVDRSIYGVVPHPIYAGFIIACAGAAIFCGSASGLWLVTPAAALGCSALVLGYELPDLRRRFGVPAASCWLPQAAAGKPSFLERIRVYLVVLLPWFAIYELFGVLGRPLGAVSTYLPFEMRWPVIEQTEIIYASTYLVVLLTPLLATSGFALRRFALRGLRAMSVIFPLYLLLPVFVPPRPFQPTGPMGTMLAMERTPFSGSGAFPSFHVVWALIAASALGEGSKWKKRLWWIWAVLVSLSCITTGMHSVLDVIAGVIAYIAIVRIDRIWALVLKFSERIANSWREWRIGPVRIIIHGAYAGAAALIGVLIIESLVGRDGTFVAAGIFFGAIIGAVLWAQWVEGSPSLLRPMGFYGGVIGAMIGTIPAVFLGINFWTALAAFAVAGPWIQAAGRLRCLVQGCCHGRATVDVSGIRYTHPRSRVCRLAQLAGVSIHATPVYSILWNFVVGASLLRLLAVHASGTMICGIYFLLSGAGRFAEEAYRGEPQTAVWCGLHMYQWIAAITFVLGTVFTTLPSPVMNAFTPLSVSAMLLGVACAAICWFVSGVDFPEVSRRFARLT
ncbi:MAG TPA: prolipoprotein diacylglyceryl transferase family protein [Terracidiphilus sp.]|nr:prolipoprotein diacylglyceryl transferase family protein [Terracidiphilus sp.]